MKGRILTTILIILLLICNYIPILNAESTTATLYPSEDTYVSQTYLDGNHGSEKIIKIRSKHGGNTNQWWGHDALIHFDITSIPVNVYIYSAKLYMYYYSYQDSDPVGRDLDIYRLNSQWSEDTATWGSHPRNAGKITSTTTIPFSYSWIYWNVESDIQDFIDGKWNNYGWRIVDKESWGDVNIPTPFFYSKENEDYSPYLIIEYSYEPPNNPPTADAGGPYIGYKNISIVFDSSKSNDSDGTIVGYRWNFTNNSSWDTNWTTNTSVNFTYNISGNFTAILQVMDDDNATSIDYVNVTILPNKIPYVNFTYSPIEPVVNETIYFVDHSFDYDGEVVNYSWDFGDGNNSEIQNVNYSYNLTGNYTVNLTITDDFGDKNYTSQIIVIKEYQRGDFNKDGYVNLYDIQLLIRYLFRGCASPNPIYTADFNNDGKVSIADLLCAKQYL